MFKWEKHYPFNHCLVSSNSNPCHFKQLSSINSSWRSSVDSSNINIYIRNVTQTQTHDCVHGKRFITIN